MLYWFLDPELQQLLSRQEGEAELGLGNTQTQELVIGNWVLDNGIDISWEHSRGGFRFT